MVADHQELLRRDLKTLHDEVKRRRVWLQLRESVSACDIREPLVEAVLLEKGVNQLGRLVRNDRQLCREFWKGLGYARVERGS